MATVSVNPDDPTISTDCESFVFPANTNPGDCYRPEVNVGPGLNLYIFKTPFTATPTAVSVAAKLAVTAPATTPDGIGPLIGEFSKAANTAGTIRVDGRNVRIPSEQKWAVKITNTQDSYRKLARLSQNGGIEGHFYVVDQNGQWFGGQNGICPRVDGGPAVLVLSDVIPTGETAPQTIEGDISAFGLYDALVIDSPVALVI